MTQRLNSYLGKLAFARAHRAAISADLPKIAVWLCDEVAFLDSELRALAGRFNHPDRHHRQPSLELVATIDQSLGLATGFQWRSRTGKRMRKPPTKDAIAKACKPQFLNYQIGARSRALDLAASFRAHRQIALELFAACRGYLSSTSPGSDISFKDWHQMGAWMAGVLAMAGNRAESLDRDLNQALAKFNAIARRRNGTILAKWEIDGRPSELVTGPRGPSFFTMSAKPAGRILYRVSDKTAPAGGRNRITERLIAACYLGRYKDSYLKQAAAIASDRSALGAVAKTLKRAAKTLRPYLNQSPVQVPTQAAAQTQAAGVAYG